MPTTNQELQALRLEITRDRIALIQLINDLSESDADFLSGMPTQQRSRDEPTSTVPEETP